VRGSIAGTRWATIPQQGIDRTHTRFTMLEFYQAFADLSGNGTVVEQLFAAAGKRRWWAGNDVLPSYAAFPRSEVGCRSLNAALVST